MCARACKVGGGCPRRKGGESHPTHNLQLDGLAIELNGPDFKVNANGGDVGVSIRVVRKTQEQAGLAHTAVANQEKLEEKVAAAGKGARAGRGAGEERRSENREWNKGESVSWRV